MENVVYSIAAAVIGPVTAGTARELGISVAVEASEYTIPGLVDALVRHFGPHPLSDVPSLPKGEGDRG